MRFIGLFLLIGLSLPASASIIDSWSPQVVDYVYVNNTVNETIEYSITTSKPMAVNTWSVDGIPVAGTAGSDTYSYTHRWDNQGIGSHTVTYNGNNNESTVGFRWYVNVYEIGGYRGGNLFDVIDDTLENHITDIKIQMFKYRIEKEEGNADLASQKVRGLREEITRRKMTRESILKEFKAGEITLEEYVSALKQIKRDEKYDFKQARELAKISKDELKDERSGEDFEKISEMEDDREDFKDEKKEQEIKSHDKNTGKNKRHEKKEDPENKDGENDSND
ncbi:Uncharacterised protein [uncultured archaeon]|nr:Uncharacterised protein [uncultured archaeon]